MGLLKSRKINRAELQHRLTQYQIPENIQNSLFNHLEQAQDTDLYRMNPRYLASKLRLDERQTLDLLALGLREGLFTLNWEVQCPACHSQISYFNSLQQSHSHVRCIGCSTEFEAHFDDHVQVTFNIHPNIRTLSKNVTKTGDVLSQVLRQSQQGQRATADGNTLTVLKLKREQEVSFAPLTAHELLTIQAFRDFFKSETLPEGENFEVRRVAMLFTDLAGSTALYTRKGDPNAYNLVREHFTILRQVVDQNQGAVIKTIGDAVMAAFISEANAMRAAVQAQHEIQAYNRNHNLPDNDCLMLKIGLHAGPSLYVSLNERLDYFGSTVNTAARTESQSQPGQIVFTEAILNAPGVRELLQAYHLEDNEVQLKGLDGKTRLWRITLEPASNAPLPAKVVLG